MTAISALRLRVTLPDGRWMGPGKADLLDGIAATGSIAAAGRQMGMSYKRAWGLVEAMNAMFGTPLVLSNRGGAGHGGAALTAKGQEVLRLYREITLAAAGAAAPQIDALLQLATDMSERK